MNEENKGSIKTDIPEDLVKDALEAVEGHKKGKKAKQPVSKEGKNDNEKELYERLLRVSADFDNYKKRAQKEKENYIKFATEPLIKDLLPVMDDFKRAIEHADTGDPKALAEGIKMIYSQLKSVLKKHGVTEIKSENETFDPLHHEAVGTEHIEGMEEDKIVKVMQDGYLLNGRLIRPAKVIVNKPTEQKSSENNENGVEIPVNITSSEEGE